ncbi:carbon-nitrogen hydrolase family protein [Metapseudomonas lalkuanensis]|uniref:carbon-nitrogen hydrolase family protein n=1 Tax=Metapseudomonas lalkuanensis TaxID=2604832 RepID=UPI001CF22C5E|nr:carbon-nitrogen hydrolase family protein [Pseudomonas lalkuanensis]UCO98682.1 carbon-nitrogen hydrolase family protein [Pseudomonas lalkuanensis]
MRIALYQCPPLPLEPAANLDRLRQRAAAAARRGAALLVTPEMYLSGYNIGLEAVSSLAQAADGDWAGQVAGIAREHGIALLYGYPERSAEGNIFNSVQLIDAQGQRLGNYRKTHLFGELDRSMFSAGGDDYPLLELNGWKLGMLICYDVEFPENVRRLALAGADAILVPTANMEPYDFVCDVLVRARAFESQCYLAYANYCGAEGEIRYCGLSSVSAPDGSQAAICGREETLAFADLRRDKLEASREGLTYLRDRRAELYRPLL